MISTIMICLLVLSVYMKIYSLLNMIATLIILNNENQLNHSGLSRAVLFIRALANRPTNLGMRLDNELLEGI